MIVSIAIAIAALGVFMLSVLYARIRAVNDEVGLKKHRSKAAGFADLLNYAAVVDDGVIVGKNGAFMAAWMYQGDDNASSTEVQREQVSMRINQALSGLGNGWMVHVDAVRRPAPNYMARGRSHFPDPVSAAIDEERRRLFESLGTMYEGYFVLTATSFPPLLAQKKFVEMMFDDDAVAPNHTARTHGLIAHFKRECVSIESRLSSAVKLSRLRGQKVANEDSSSVTHDEFLRWLQFCTTGLNHPVMLPSQPMYLDALIGGQEMWGGVVPKIGRKFVQVVAMEGFPLESTPGILTALGEQACEYRWRSRIWTSFARSGSKRFAVFLIRCSTPIAAAWTRMRCRWWPMPRRRLRRSIAVWWHRATTPASWF
jgi:type IV secretion system protein TrbE